MMAWQIKFHTKNKNIKTKDIMAKKRTKIDGPKRSLCEWAEDRFSAYDVDEFLYWMKQTHGVEADTEITEDDYDDYEKEFHSLKSLSYESWVKTSSGMVLNKLHSWRALEWFLAVLQGWV